MKRLICATLASALTLSLLGAGAAEAAPRYGHASYSRGWHGYHRHDDGAAAAIGLGLGLFALAALAANAHDDYYAPPPAAYGPPPPPAYGPAYGPPPPADYGW
jgi:hypothetical protein